MREAPFGRARLRLRRLAPTLRAAGNIRFRHAIASLLLQADRAAQPAFVPDYTPPRNICFFLTLSPNLARALRFTPPAKRTPHAVPFQTLRSKLLLASISSSA